MNYRTKPVTGSNFDDVERILDRHARRLAREIGGLLVDLGEALRGQAGEPQQPGSDHEPTREELLRQAEQLGVEGRSRMSKDELRRAIEQMRGK